MRIPAAPNTRAAAPNAPGYAAPQIAEPRNATPAIVGDLGQSLTTLGAGLARQGEQDQEVARQERARAEAAAARAQARIDSAMARETDAALGDKLREVLHAPDGYLNTLGLLAVQGRQKALDAVEAARRDLAERLMTPEQRQAFDLMAADRLLSAQTAVDNHYARQAHVYEMAGATARTQSLAADMTTAQLSGDVAGFERARDDLFGRNNTAGELQRVFTLSGTHPDDAKLIRQKTMDSVYGSILGQLVDAGRLTEANDLLKAHPLSEGVTSTMKGRIGAAVVADRAQKLAEFAGADGADILTQVDRMEQWHREMPDSFPIEIFDDAVKRAEARDALKQKAMERIAAQADKAETRRKADATKVWEGVTERVRLANGVLSEPDQAELVRTGQLDKFRLFQRDGGLYKLDSFGTDLLAKTGKELREDYRSEEALAEAARWHLSPSDFLTVMKSYRAGGAAVPDAISKQLVVESFRSINGLPDSTPIVEGSGTRSPATVAQFNRWSAAVEQRAESLKTNDAENLQPSHYRAAIEQLRKEGWFTSKAAAEKGDITENFKTAALVGEAELKGVTAFVVGPDGQTYEANLTNMDPRSKEDGGGGTYLQSIDRWINEEANKSLPGKPSGFVKDPYSGTLYRAEDIPRNVAIYWAYKLEEQVNRTQKTVATIAPSIEQVNYNEEHATLRKAHEAEVKGMLADAAARVLQAHSNTLRLTAAERAAPETIAPWLREEALHFLLGEPTSIAIERGRWQDERFQRRWSAYGLTADDVRTILGVPAQAPAAKEQQLLELARKIRDQGGKPTAEDEAKLKELQTPEPPLPDIVTGKASVLNRGPGGQ